QRGTNYKRWRGGRAAGSVLLALDVQHLVNVGVDVRAGRAAGCRVAAYQMELAVDDVAGEAVARKSHRRETRPVIGRRVVGFDRAERSLPRALRALLAAGDVDPAFPGAPRGRAARRRHGREQRAPLVDRRIV